MLAVVGYDATCFPAHHPDGSRRPLPLAVPESPGGGREQGGVTAVCVSVMSLALNVSGLLLSLEGHASRSGMWPALQVINMV